ncbi:hypothetical protein ASE75_05990 [Sphingomonas sp. Leaf17]|uniref:hypothetical protein n=1 Tax=Sphingomonas sp. Leaf17 TaxID=1735683 RepID=UPI0006FD3BCA|nr:hypothetical protein [Sphingomonas sp. Leaf17]KQM65780.1 hypothetical protein ASE75_05990 [Sphingomonas sp. Leaf17]
MSTIIAETRGGRGLSAAEQSYIAGDITAPTQAALSEYLRAPAITAAALADAERQASVAQRAAIAGDLAGRQPVSAVLTRLAQRVYINDLAGIVEGSVSLSQAVINAAVINAAIVSGTMLYIRPGSWISLGGQLQWIRKSYCGVVWDGSGARPYLHMHPAWFTNVRPASVSGSITNDPRAALIRVDGSAALDSRDVRFEGVGIAYDGGGGRYLAGISAIGVHDFRMLGCEVTGIPNGFGITAGSLQGDTQLRDNRIHDFYDDSLKAFDGSDWLGRVQSTGIELDNNRYPGVYSVGVRIMDNTIERIMKSELFASLPINGPPTPGKPTAMQTDGINIGNDQTRGTIVSGNLIDTVSEGIDNFGSYGSISYNIVRNAWDHGIKLVHGAEGNALNGNIIENAGLTGLTMGDGNVRSVRANVATGGTISGVGYNGVWLNLGAMAAVRFGASTPAPGRYQAMDNVVNGVTIMLTPKTKFGWFGDKEGDADLRNRGVDINMVGTPLEHRVRIDQSAGGFYNGGVRLVGSSTYITSLAA